MPIPPLICQPSVQEITVELERIRDELDIPKTFPAEVLAEAASSASRGPEPPPGAASTTVLDRTNLHLVTIDPPGSLDLDQAFGGEKRGDGWRVFYAIADVAAWVSPGGAIDQEAQGRGLTMYSPDSRSPLHPVELSEGAASLLPGVERQSLLWTIDLDDAGNATDAHLERALVRSTAKLTYRDATIGLDTGETEVLWVLREVGLRREALEIERGAVSLNLAQQEVVYDGGGNFKLAYDESLPVEGWNAQISLLTGMAAATIMLDGGVGILRTLPEPDERTLRQLRRTARALDIDWPKSAAYAEVVRSLNPADPREAALIAQSARGLRGAGYLAFDGDRPERAEHSAIAANYAHVTAPLRRLGDRFANECVLSLCANERPPEWALVALPELPSLLGRARNKEGALDRSIVDLVEAAILRNRVGERFTGIVTDVDEDKQRAKIQLKDPAVVAYADGVGELGDVAEVVLVKADMSSRSVRFELT